MSSQLLAASFSQLQTLWAEQYFYPNPSFDWKSASPLRCPEVVRPNTATDRPQQSVSTKASKEGCRFTSIAPTMSF